MKSLIAKTVSGGGTQALATTYPKTEVQRLAYRRWRLCGDRVGQRRVVGRTSSPADARGRERQLRGSQRGHRS